MSVTPTPQHHTAQNRRGVRDHALSRSGAFVFMAIFTTYFLIPIWWLLVAASKDRGDFANSAPLWFAEMNLFSNVSQLFTFRDGIYLRWMLNAVIYSGVGALGGTIISVMCGYALAKYTFKGKELIFNVILAGVLVPATALALPLFLLFSSINQTNTYWSVLLPSLVSPFGVYLARIYAAASVPNEIMEAARIDGSHELRTFATISSRLMAPATVTIFLFQFVAIWNNFFLPLIMLSDEKLFPVTMGLYTWNSQTMQAPEIRTLVIVGAFMSILPLVIAFLSLQRYWQSGLAAGGVK